MSKSKNLTKVEEWKKFQNEKSIKVVAMECRTGLTSFKPGFRLGTGFFSSLEVDLGTLPKEDADHFCSKKAVPPQPRLGDESGS